MSALSQLTELMKIDPSSYQLTEEMYSNLPTESCGWWKRFQNETAIRYMEEGYLEILGINCAATFQFAGRDNRCVLMDIYSLKDPGWGSVFHNLYIILTVRRKDREELRAKAYLLWHHFKHTIPEKTEEQYRRELMARLNPAAN